MSILVWKFVPTDCTVPELYVYSTSIDNTRTVCAQFQNCLRDSLFFFYLLGRHFEKISRNPSPNLYCTGQCFALSSTWNCQQFEDVIEFDLRSIILVRILIVNGQVSKTFANCHLSLSESDKYRGWRRKDLSPKNYFYGRTKKTVSFTMIHVRKPNVVEFHVSFEFHTKKDHKNVVFRRFTIFNEISSNARWSQN